MALLKDIQLARPALLMDEMQLQPALHRISTAPGTFDVSCSLFAFRAEPAKAAVQRPPRNEPDPALAVVVAAALVATIAWEVQAPAGPDAGRNAGTAGGAGPGARRAPARCRRCRAGLGDDRAGAAAVPARTGARQDRRATWR